MVVDQRGEGAGGGLRAERARERDAAGREEGSFARMSSIGRGRGGYRCEGAGGAQEVRGRRVREQGVQEVQGVGEGEEGGVEVCGRGEEAERRGQLPGGRRIWRGFRGGRRTG